MAKFVIVCDVDALLEQGFLKFWRERGFPDTYAGSNLHFDDRIIFWLTKLSVCLDITNNIQVIVISESFFPYGYVSLSHVVDRLRSLLPMFKSKQIIGMVGCDALESAVPIDGNNFNSYYKKFCGMEPSKLAFWSSYGKCADSIKAEEAGLLSMLSERLTLVNRVLQPMLSRDELHWRTLVVRIIEKAIVAHITSIKDYGLFYISNSRNLAEYWQLISKRLQDFNFFEDYHRVGIDYVMISRNFRNTLLLDYSQTMRFCEKGSVMPRCSDNIYMLYLFVFFIYPLTDIVCDDESSPPRLAINAQRANIFFSNFPQIRQFIFEKSFMFLDEETFGIKISYGGNILMRGDLFFLIIQCAYLHMLHLCCLQNEPYPMPSFAKIVHYDVGFKYWELQAKDNPKILKIFNTYGALWQSLFEIAYRASVDDAYFKKHCLIELDKSLDYNRDRAHHHIFYMPEEGKRGPIYEITHYFRIRFLPPEDEI